jgi:2-oxoglutarate dehydrogenase E2 component (dihydrolipoamide succinyltransferase)
LLLKQFNKNSFKKIKMILEMKVPSPGESITEVEIATWLVKDGDYVEKDQALLRLTLMKATLELPAEAGIITLEEWQQSSSLFDTEGAKPEGSDKSEGSPAEALRGPVAKAAKPTSLTPAAAPAAATCQGHSSCKKILDEKI